MTTPTTIQAFRTGCAETATSLEPWLASHHAKESAP